MLLVYLLVLIGFCRADQVVLLDTTKEASLEWTRYPFGPEAQTPGWVEESFTNFEKGINWRSYVVCDVAYQNVNNWLWTPFIERGAANRMYIEVKFTIRDCSLFPGNALSCKETFSLLFYEFDAVTREPPPWEPESYRLIGRVAAGEGRFNTNSEVVINTEVKSIAVTKKGVYFAFRDQGACISVLAIKVYYITCPAITINFARFAETPTGKEITVIEQTIGRCVENAEMIDTPTYLCKGDGKWTLPSGGCRCKDGFEPDEEQQKCRKCPAGTYRSSNMTRCLRCPAHSYTAQPGSAFCKCAVGYSRTSDEVTAACKHTPSPPDNLTLLYVDQSSIVLTWSEPRSANLSASKDNEVIVYSVKCFECDAQTVYQPQTLYFNSTKISLSNLQPSTKYKIQISSKVVQKYSNLPTTSSNISDSFGSMDYAEIVVSTDPNNKSQTDTDLRVSSITSMSAELTWTRGPQDDLYEVRWYAQDMRNDAAQNSTSLITKDNHVNVNNLHPGIQYAFQMRAKSQGVWSVFTRPVFQRTASIRGPEHEPVDDVQVRVVAGATVAVVSLLVIGIVAAVVYLRSKTADELDKNHCPLKLDYATNEVTMDTAPIVKTIQNNVTTPLFSTNRSYIDPHTYEDLSQAIKEFAREIDASYITIEAIIGGGEFGDVCKGKMKIMPDYVEIDVAIKTLKPGSSDKSRCDFLTEASIMGQFEHPNVIYLQGVVTRSYPVMIITEFMENGSLDTFLRANDGKFQILQLVGMLRGISSGMAYLSDMSYVHRDLAARNVLVNSYLVCKIADFGLSREMENSTEAYTTRGGKIPVRWTAPEAIAFRKFTSASDVWSFGIVLWEVMSYGERPYWNWSNQDVIKSIEKGYRLPAPMDCPELLYQLMLDCWQKQRTHRPGFGNITLTLDNLVRCPEALKKLASGVRPAITQDEDNTRSLEPINEFQNVDQWLTAIKMSKYIGHFHAACVTSKQQIAHLNAVQLRNMGITLVGHQKKILHRAHQLLNQM